MRPDLSVNSPKAQHVVLERELDELSFVAGQPHYIPPRRMI